MTNSSDVASTRVRFGTAHRFLWRHGLPVQTPSERATGRSSPSMIPTGICGWSRRSQPGTPAGLTPRRRPLRQPTIWQARCAVRQPHTASMRSATGSKTRIGRTGTPRTWRRSKQGLSYRSNRVSTSRSKEKKHQFEEKKMAIKLKAMKTAQIYRADSAPQAPKSALRGSMQRLGLTLLAFMLVIGVTGTASASQAQDEAAVRALGDNFAKAFVQKNPEQRASLFTENGTFVTPTGDFLQGRVA